MNPLHFLKTTSILALAITSNAVVADGLHTEDQSEKRSAAEYWADFKQDSKQTWKDSKEAFKDGWIESKLETALMLNKHLSALEIDIHVDSNVATLAGEVHSDIEKELAENIALGIEGIDSVKNNLQITPRPIAANSSIPTQNTRRSFLQYVSDVSTTATIKTQLLASKNVEGLEINVDTFNNIVTLSGTVDTSTQRELAQAIAAKQDDVKSVVNKLQIKS